MRYLLPLLLVLPSITLGQSFGAPEDVATDITKDDIHGRIPQRMGPDNDKGRIAFPLPLFTEGLHTRFSPNVIPETALTEALNIVIDEDVDGVVVRRNGRSRCNATAIEDAQTIRGQWRLNASDGTNYHVSFSSASFWEHSGDCVWTQIDGLNGYATDLDFDCAQGLGRLWCTNTDVVISWDGTTTALITTAPDGSLIDVFRNRLLISNVSGSQSQIHLSGDLDGEDWTLPTIELSTSPADIPIGGVNDGDNVTCLMGTYGDKYLIGKENALFSLYGFSNDDFTLREISREVGCLEDRSVQEKNNRLYWLSKRGVERLSGNIIERVSDPVRDLVDIIIATAGNPREIIDTTQADFEAGEANPNAAGPGAPMSTTISPGNVVPTTFTVTDDTLSDFNTGTITTFLEVKSAGTVEFSTLSLSIEANGDFDDDLDGWTCVLFGAPTCSAVTAASGMGPTQMARMDLGSPAIQGNKSKTVSLIDSDDSVLYTQALSLSISVTTVTITAVIDFIVPSSGVLRIQFLNTSEGISTTLTSSTFAVFDSVSFIYQSSDDPNPLRLDVDLIQSEAGRHFDVSQSSQIGTFTSAIFDTGFSTPTGGVFSATFTSVAGEAEVFFDIRSSTSANDDLWTDFRATSDTLTIGATQQYWQYRARFHTIITTKTAVIDTVNLVASTTGQFISQGLEPGVFASWGRFSCNLDDAGNTFLLYVSTGDSEQTVTRTTATWNLQTNNAVIAIDTAPFIAYRVDYDFAVFVASRPMIFRDCTVRFSSSTERPPVASAVYKDRYYLSYTSSTLADAFNDHQLVLDRNDKWTLFDNTNCYSLVLYERNLYCGSSENDGFVYQQDVGDDDDGSIYVSRIRTKAFDMGYPQYRKHFEAAYFDLKFGADQESTGSMSARFVVDRGTFTHSLGSITTGDDTNHILDVDVPFTFTGTTEARYIQLELETSGKRLPWRLYGGRLYWRPIRRE